MEARHLACFPEGAGVGAAFQAEAATELCLVCPFHGAHRRSFCGSTQWGGSKGTKRLGGNSGRAEAQSPPSRPGWLDGFLRGGTLGTCQLYTPALKMV